MGFYIRKGLSAGPFRFNISKSGLGVSAGVRGFRVGSGPRGNYVHMGRNGLYYRTTLPSGRNQSPVEAVDIPQAPSSEVVIEDLTGASAIALTPTGGGDVIAQLNAAATRRGWGWPTVIACAVAGVLTMPWGLAVWALGALAAWWVFKWDAARRAVVLFYDVNDEEASWYETVVESWTSLAAAANVWREIQTGHLTTTHQVKANAGASSVVSRLSARADLAGPKHLKSNIAIPSATAGTAAIYFLPDRVLVREGKHYSDALYADVAATASTVRFIEDMVPVPRDAEQVGETWRYVNLKGGPDRRFANNALLPIMLYGQLDLQSSRGLRWRLQASRATTTSTVERAVNSAPARRSET